MFYFLFSIFYHYGLFTVYCFRFTIHDLRFTIYYLLFTIFIPLGLGKTQSTVLDSVSTKVRTVVSSMIPIPLTDLPPDWKSVRVHNSIRPYLLPPVQVRTEYEVLPTCLYLSFL